MLLFEIREQSKLTNQCFISIYTSCVCPVFTLRSNWKLISPLWVRNLNDDKESRELRTRTFMEAGNVTFSSPLTKNTSMSSERCSSCRRLWTDDSVVWKKTLRFVYIRKLLWLIASRPFPENRSDQCLLIAGNTTRGCDAKEKELRVHLLIEICSNRFSNETSSSCSDLPMLQEHDRQLWSWHEYTRSACIKSRMHAFGMRVLLSGPLTNLQQRQLRSDVEKKPESRPFSDGRDASCSTVPALNQHGCPSSLPIPVALFSNLAPVHHSTLIASPPVRGLGFGRSDIAREGKSANTNIVPPAFYKPGEWGS